MASPASIRKHPLHPMLVAFPIGLWTFALICDLAQVFRGGSAWSHVALYCVGGGIIGALAAAIPGLIDYFSIEDARTKRTANLHLCINLGAVLVYLLNFWLRFHLPSESTVPLLLSCVGVVAMGAGGWLGGEMVYLQGMAVEAVDQVAKVRQQPRVRRVS
jgi:uncharacterized membrane protein